MSLENAAQAGDATQPQGGDFSLHETVGVLVNLPLEREYIEAIEAVDPRVRVLCVYEPRGNGASGGDGEKDEEDTSAWREVTGDDLDALLAQAEVYVGFRFPIEWIERAPKLRWVQLASAGSDHMLRAGLFDK